MSTYSKYVKYQKEVRKKREECLELAENLLQEYSNFRECLLEEPLGTVHELLEGRDEICIGLYELVRKLNSGVYPGIRISDTEVILPGDEVAVLDYGGLFGDGETRFCVVVGTGINSKTDLLYPGPYIKILGRGGVIDIKETQFHKLRLDKPFRRLPISEFQPPELDGKPLALGDRVRWRGVSGLGAGEVVYLCQIPETGVFVEFDTGDLSSPMFVGESDFDELFCRE